MTPPSAASGGRRRWQSVSAALAVLLVLVAGVGMPFAVGAAAGDIPQLDGDRLQSTTAVSAAADRTVVYGNGSDTLTTLWSDGSTTGLGVDADALGPMAEVDDDGEMEIPYVKNGKLLLVEPDGDVRTLVDGRGVGSYSLAVGDWDGDGNKSVFYSDGKYLTRVEVTTGEREEFGVKSKGTGGVGDIDGDGSLEIVYSGSSGQLRYLNEDGSSVKTSYPASGIGTPYDFDGDGITSVPVVDGSNNVKLVSIADDTADKLSVSSKKTSIGLADVTGDSSPEVLYLETKNSPAEIKYVTLSGETDYLHDDSGARIVGSTNVGIADVLTSAPRISDYDVTNPSDREVEVTFTASKNLDDLSVALSRDGSRLATLTESGLEKTGGGPYHYVGTYTTSSDGDYTATLTEAVGPSGMDGASNQSGTVTVRTPTPTVTDVSVSDATDGDGYVAGGDSVRVTATVHNESALASVTADTAGFGAGTVSLHHADGDQYAADVTVDAAVPDDGQTGLTVTARNEYDHANVSASGTLFVDTTPPTADAGPDRTVDEDTATTFDADGSRDNTAIASYTWTFDDGTTVTNVTAAHTYPDPGTYTPELTVTDVVGHTATDRVTMTVENVSTDRGMLAVTDATLTDASDGDGYVSDGDSVRVSASIENESNVTVVRADVSAFGAGTVTLSRTDDGRYATTVAVDAATVTDDGSSPVTVTAVDEYNQADTATTGTLFIDTTPPTADAGPDRTIEEDTATTFDADGSRDNAAIESYTWTFDDGSTVSGVMAKHDYPDPGTYTPELTVTDTVGHTATDRVTMTVENVSADRGMLAVTDATLDDATDGDGYVGDGDSVRISASIENESNVTAVRTDASAFGAGTVTLSRTGDGRYATTASVDAANVTDDGPTHVEVTAIDEYNQADTSATETVFLDTTPPTADAGENATIEEGTKLVLDGDGSSDGGEIARYRWTFDDGSTVNGVMAKRTYADPGTYTPELTVTDTVGHTADATVAVNVTNVSDDADESTETNVVYVDSGGGGGVVPYTTDERATERVAAGPDTVLRQVNERAVEVQFENVSADSSTAVSLRNLSETDVAPVRRLKFVSTQSGDFSMTVRDLEGPPPGVPRLSERAGVNATGYFEINHSVADAHLNHVELTLVVPRENTSIEGEKTLLLYRYHDGGWQAYDADLLNTTATDRVYRVDLPGLSRFGVAVRRPLVTVEAIERGAETVAPGDRAVVRATVHNDGPTRGTRTISLTVDGESVASHEVSLAPGANRTVTFAPAFQAVGTYRLAVENASAGTVTVERAAAAAERTTTTTQTASGQGGSGTADEEAGATTAVSALLGWPLAALLVFALLAALVGYRRSRS